MVNQREVGPTDVDPASQTGLRSALREDPDVVPNRTYEMRDLDSISITMSLAEPAPRVRHACDTNAPPSDATACRRVPGAA